MNKKKVNLSKGECFEEEIEPGKIGKEEGCEHLDGHMTGIDESVTKEEAESLTALLKKYSDVFFKNEVDLGETQLAKHPMYTGDCETNETDAKETTIPPVRENK